MTRVRHTSRPRVIGAAALTACLVIAACAGSSGPSPTVSMPATVRTIEAGTQLHLEGVGVGVGNIWEETYTTAAGATQSGFTASLAITVDGDTSLNQNVRVHPGQHVDVPGYRLRVVAVEPNLIQLDVIEATE
jgi:hypothetical protein